MLDCTGTLYAVVPWLLDVPPLGVLNMPTGRPDEGYVWLPNGDRFECDYEVDLVVAWNADEAAHIEAVTGEPLLSDGGFVAWDGGKLPVGVVAARFHVTGCHQGEWLTDTKMCCDSPWARSDDDWWHWTGTAEKVNP